MSNADRKTRKRRYAAPVRKLGWVVPTKRQPLFPVPAKTQNPAALPVSSHDAAVSNPVVRVTEPVGRLKQTQLPTSTARNNSPSTATKTRAYCASARRPIVSLYFVLPLILAYECAKISAGVEQISSGVDLWIHQLLCVFGAGQLVILPLMTVAVLLFHHHSSTPGSNDWSVNPSTLPMMAGEAIGLGLMLFFFANLFQIAATTNPAAGRLVDPYFWQIGTASWWSQVVTYVGTGIHEELIFRMILMLPLIKFLQNTFTDKQAATLIAVIVTGLIFSAAHVDAINPLGEAFHGISFAFRFIASCIFSAILLYRGFGIVVGTHIIYNVLTLIA